MHVKLVEGEIMGKILNSNSSVIDVFMQCANMAQVVLYRMC